MSIGLISLILAVAAFFLITEKIPLDLTALGILVVLMATGILSPAEALAGFSNTSVITIGSMFILSRGLMRTGALGFASQKLIEVSHGHENRILLISMAATAIASAFVNNTPVVVLFITILMSVCCEYGLSPSRYLIPISYSSIVGGMTTLIGTSTNLIVSDLSARYGYGPIRMFELAPVGGVILVVTLLLLYVAAPRVLPRHKAPVCEMKETDARHYLAELVVGKASKLLQQKDLCAFFAQNYPGIELYEIIRGPVITYPEREPVRVVENDLLFLKGSASDLVGLLKAKLVELPHKVKGPPLKVQDEKSLIVELIITPQSGFIGEPLVPSRFQQALGVHVIAVKRRGIHYSEQKLHNLKLTTGDTLLVQCAKERLDEIRNRPDFIILEDIHHQIVDKKKAPLAVSIFAGMILAASSGMVSITVSALAAVFLMVLSGCIQLRSAYRAVDVRILLMIVGTIALGTAMEKTGAARVYADLFLGAFHWQNPAAVLSALILLTCIITELMSNSATAVILFPIAISTAISLGVNPKPFIMGVCLGASCGFAIPIGYQTHLLVFGPGGYRFKDFLKLGIPMDLLVWLISSLMIPILWPF